MRSEAAGQAVGLVARLVVVAVVLVVGVMLTAVSPILTLALITCLLFASGGWFLGQPKGHGTSGLFLGLFLGPIGLLIVAVMEPTDAVRSERDRAAAGALAAAVRPSDAGRTRVCPWCAETIKAAAIICRHCGRDVTPTATAGA